MQDYTKMTFETPENQDISRVMVVGDLHISDRYSGRHIDYMRDCTEVLDQITNKIRENKITHLFLTGDLIGRTTEKNLQSRDTLLYFIQVLQLWNDLTNGNVYSNRGNHDFGSKLTDFEFLVSVKMLKHQDFVDIGGCRVHLIDWGDHNREISVDPDRYNIAIMHTNLQIEGVTNWFRGGNDGVELSSLTNLYGVKLVIGGHIHTPSVRVVETSIKDETVSLIYPGNPTRPRFESNLWEKCLGVLIETDGDSVSLGTTTFDLRPVHEVFHRTYEDIKDDGVVDEQSTFSIEEISEILGELKNYNLIGEGNYKDEIKKLGGLDQEAVDLAISYVEKVEGVLK